MTTFHCDKLCMGECCTPLRWALNCEYDDLPSCGCESALCQAQLAADDPAKLAELMVMAMRARGIEAQPLEPRDGMCAFACACEGDAARWMRAMPQARAATLAIMSTPADESSKGRVEALIRGEK